MKDVYVDLDGVLFDFVKRFDEKYGKLSDFSHDELVECKKRMADDGFFLELPKMAEADELLLWLEDAGHKVTILTSVGKYGSQVIAKDKQESINALFGMFDFKGFKWVTSSKKKAVYAKDANSVLIDDREKSCDPWVEAGGTAILYDGFKNCVGELERILG